MRTTHWTSCITGLDCAYTLLSVCLVTSVRSNKISSLVQSPVEMRAFFCDGTDDGELDIDALMLPASQHYERTLLTPSRPNVRPKLPAPCSTVQLSVAAPVSRPHLSSIPRIPTCRYHAPRLLPMAIMYIHALGK